MDDIKPQEAGAFPAPPELSLEVDDKKLVEYIDTYVKRAKKEIDKHNIKKRREINRRYYFGQQVDPFEHTYRGVDGERAIKSYEKPYVDNVIKEGIDTSRPILLSRLPDLVVSPGTEDNDRSEEVARVLSDAVSRSLSKMDIREVITMANRHHATDFIGVIKAMWDPNKGRNGDFKFVAIPPENIVFDFTATKADQEEMSVIVQYVKRSIKEWIIQFPNKEDEIKKYARDQGRLADKESEEALAVDLRLEEVWFDYWNKDEEWEKLSGVLWKAGKTILDKRQDPNWDWEGQEEMYLQGQPIPDELLPQLAMMGNQLPGLERRKSFRNFFLENRKPFIFLSFEQYGRMALDETNRVEENVLLQQNYDIRGMQVTKMIDDAQGKHVFSSLSGLKKETVEQMDLSNPDEDLFIDGDLREVHAYISKEQPSDAMFGDLARTRERVLSKMSVHGATRGEIQTSTATTNQIAREADFTVKDEEAEFLVTKPVVEMAEWILHFMKLRYTEEHFQALVGDRGDELHFTLTNDLIEDGMEVQITASTTDKLRSERQAKEEASLGLIDPINYFRDTGRKDPEKRAEMLFLFQQSPELYFKRFVESEDMEGIAAQVMQQNQQNLAQAQGGQGAPMQPSPQNTSDIATQPQGSPRNLVGRAGQALSQMFNRGA